MKTTSCYAVATLSHPLLLQLHPHVFVSSYQRSQNSNILIIHAHVILMLYSEAFLDHKKEKKKTPRNIHAFKEDSPEIMMMTNSKPGTRINFVRQISLMCFFISGTFVTHWQPYCWEAHRKISKCSLPIRLYHMYIQTQGSWFCLGLRTRDHTYPSMQKQYS